MKKVIDTIIWFCIFAISVFFGLRFLMWKNDFLADAETGYGIAANGIVFILAACGFISSYLLNKRMKDYFTAIEYISKFSNLFMGYTSVIVFCMGILDYVYNKQ